MSSTNKSEQSQVNVAARVEDDAEDAVVEDAEHPNVEAVSESAMLAEIQREEHHGVEGPANVNTDASEKDHVDAKAEEVPTPVGIEN